MNFIANVNTCVFTIHCITHPFYALLLLQIVKQHDRVTMRAAEEGLATQQTQLLQILHDDKMCEVGVYGSAKLCILSQFICWIC